jgi:hypothetical protein
MSVNQCQQDLLADFGRYDQAVDVVSCWEAYLSYAYGDSFDQYRFDRFPSIPAEDGPLTPDFTALFDSQYGIIGEIKRTFPTDDEAFRSELSQISRYDYDHTLLDGYDDRVCPDTCDIILLISGTDAPQIGTRLERIVDQDEEYTFDRNIVLIRYNRNTEDVLTRYEFQQATEFSGEFGDAALPTSDSLSNTIGETGDYGTMKVYPRYFARYKVQQPICNDEPPATYLATILWNKIFPDYLTERQYQRSREGNSQQVIDITLSIDDITDKFDTGYMRGSQISYSWVRSALEFLCDAGLAERSDDKYIVGFRQIVRNGGESFQEGLDAVNSRRLLATKFISRYCKRTREDVPSTQTSVDDFY